VSVYKNGSSRNVILRCSVDSSFSGPGYGPVAGSFIISDNEGYQALDHMIYKDT
jgi:hypothetical protein